VTITGTPTQGQTLTANTTTLADEDGLGTLSYQWYSGAQPVVGATGSTYTVGTSDVGQAISAKASYTDGHATLEHVVSSATASVVGTQSGQVQDGYLSNALVWVDSTPGGVRNWTDGDGDNLWDSGEGESWTLTDSTGQFTGLVGAGTIRITANPANPTGTIDISTGKAFTGSYSAPSGSKVVNPLTTLVVAAGGDESKVRTALGIDPSVTLSTYDPLAEANKTGASSTALATAIKVQSAATQVANIMDIANSVADGNTTSPVDTAAIASSIATSLLNQAGTGTVDLANSTIISTALNTAVIGVNSTTVDTIATAASIINNNIATVSTNATSSLQSGSTPRNILTQVVAAQLTAQKTAVESLNVVSGTPGASITIIDTNTLNSEITTATSQVVVDKIFTNHAPTGDVTMTGTATQGQTLTAHHTLADIDGLGTIHYQWQAEGVNISGATSDTLVLAEAQVGHQVRVVATYTDGASHDPESVNSIATAVANINDAPTGGVTISSTDLTLTANTTTLKDADGLGTFSYQWQSGGDNIDGATGSAFTFTSSDFGKSFTVTTSYTDGHGTLEFVAADPYVVTDPDPDTDTPVWVVLAGVGGLGLLAWVLF
jgi:hypothetical protein